MIKAPKPITTYWMISRSSKGSITSAIKSSASLSDITLYYNKNINGIYHLIDHSRKSGMQLGFKYVGFFNIPKHPVRFHLSVTRKAH